MTVKTQQIHIEAYDYPLPNNRIARYPLPRRDESKLLVYKHGEISETRFKQISDYLPEGSLLVFNNTRVIQARLIFHKESGARIEVFCLEPAEPSDYSLMFRQTERCCWTCLVGNLKKWKANAPLHQVLSIGGKAVTLQARRIDTDGETQRIVFTWNNTALTFADILEHAGQLPIPPYLHRETEAGDLETYQTVYAKIKGSVAAPTAGLHFTPEVLAELDGKGFAREELTLHVGAGTFKPVQSDTLEGHEMHREFISVGRPTIEHLLKYPGKIVAIGTTSVRTLESLYYIGQLLGWNPEAGADELVVSQWMPYQDSMNKLTPTQALQNVLDYLDRQQMSHLITATQIFIAPGYEYKIVRGIITNFHQPKSTLLLLISSFVKGDWERIYDYALSHDFRFLSYGDSSLLL